MSSRVHQIELPEALEKQLDARAREAGTDPATFIVRTIEEKLQSPKSYKEIFAPLQAAFADSRDSEHQLNQTFERLRDQVWESRRAKS
jgi:hypothetical protein